jgi:hypothetical protein
METDQSIRLVSVQATDRRMQPMFGILIGLWGQRIVNVMSPFLFMECI